MKRKPPPPFLQKTLLNGFVGTLLTALFAWRLANRALILRRSFLVILTRNHPMCLSSFTESNFEERDRNG